MSIRLLYTEQSEPATGFDRTFPIPILYPGRVEVVFLYYVSLRETDGMHYAAPTELRRFAMNGDHLSTESFDASQAPIGILGVRRLPEGTSPVAYLVQCEQIFRDMDNLLEQYLRGERANHDRARRVLDFYRTMAEPAFWPVLYQRVGDTFFAWLSAV
jgi:hypothetical protein